ncbi:LpxI family protein [Amaricoccus macauensis]|uniref:LpxI family protein n=1 Tax=Amaricoccus macauensis TaxID=57001 RepID=UPI003C7AE7FA
MPGAALAIVAGRGSLPRLLVEECLRRGRTYWIVRLPGVSLDWAEGHPSIPAEFEKPGRLFKALRSAGVGDVTFAGGIRRPELNPLRFDFKMLALAPKVLAGLRAGDDRTLRVVAEIFEAEGLRLVGAHELLTDLLAPEAVLTRVKPGAGDREDADRARAIVDALGRADVGQTAVVAQGLCLGIESIQGTDAMLGFVAKTARDLRPDPSGARGVMHKAPKPGQDWRIDLPAIGPDTARAAVEAGLAGIVVQAGGVLLLDRAEIVKICDAEGLFLWGRSAGA